MNRKQLQEWLNQFPEETQINVVKHCRGSGYYDQGGYASQTEFDPKPITYLDNEVIESMFCHNDIAEYVRSSGTLLLGGIDV